jgi:hypothetical protein
MENGFTEFVSKNKAMLNMIQTGIKEIDMTIMGNAIRYRVLNHGEVLDVIRSVSGYDVVSKFPLTKMETLTRSIISINGDKLPSISDTKNFLEKLPSFIVDVMYVEYEKERKMFELEIEGILVDLKNSSRGQAQEGSGIGSNSPDLPGSESFIPSQQK